MNDNQPDVITLCDYEMCPTIKSDNTTNILIVVKPNGNSYSVETGTGNGNSHGYEPVEDRTIGDALY